MATVPQPRRRRLRDASGPTTVLILVGVAILVCCGGGGLVGYLVNHAISNPTEPPRKATAAFLDDMKSGDYTGAYGRLCTQTRERFSQDQFVKVADDSGRITKYAITGISVSTSNDEGAASVETQLTREDKPAEAHTFDLRYESKRWLICGNPF